MHNVLSLNNLRFVEVKPTKSPDLQVIQFASKDAFCQNNIFLIGSSTKSDKRKE